MKAPKLVTVVSFPHSSFAIGSLAILVTKSPRWVRRNARSAPPPPWYGVLDHPQGSVSSTSCLHLQAFPSLQSFASISLFNFASFLAVLEVFFSPPISSPRPAHSAGPIGFDSFFWFFCVFLPSIFLLFFRLAFLSIFGAFGLAWTPQNQAKIGKKLLRKSFFGCFSFLC